jgi:dolichyl-phosphate-mannose--protein O-mannosyl transferase
MTEETRKDLWIALAFMALAALLRVPRLGFPQEEIFDEVYHARTALQYLHHETLTEWVHPPTAKLLIAVGVWAFGYNSWAWRLAPVLAGIVLAPTFYALARTTLPTRRAAVLASLVLAADGVYLVQSRVAMTNIFAVFFQVGAALFVVRSVLKEPLGARDMLLGGLFLGLGLSTRWTSLWAWGFLGAVTVVVRGRRLLRAKEAALLLVSFGMIPLVLYATSYIPLLEQRNDFRTWAGVWRAAKDLLGEQHRVWVYHATLVATHPYFSKWYTWPWLYRPTWYYFAQTGDYVRGIVAIGNPAIWWVTIPVTAWVLARGALRKDPVSLFAGFGFCALYLPWGVSPRTLNYSHYLFEALPYACLALGLLLDLHWDEANWRAKGYLVLVWALFAFFYPFLTAIPIPVAVFGGRWSIGLWAWFPTWI